MNEIDIAYLAGLFDGEGSVSFSFQKATKNGKRYGHLIARVAQKDRTILDWLSGQLGYGTVHHSSHGVFQYYVVRASARKFLGLIRPYVKIKGSVIDEKLALDHQYVKARLV